MVLFKFFFSPFWFWDFFFNKTSVIVLYCANDKFHYLEGNDLGSGAPRNRVGQISHSVVLGTFNVGEQGEGIVQDLSRVCYHFLCIYLKQFIFMHSILLSFQVGLCHNGLLWYCLINIMYLLHFVFRLLGMF